ncbi:tudor domain-containing protein 5 isoform X4 [Poecilia reticulata]|uniref:tudor domain-containing protein 5 isoform X4 n=1 Tax=Poecilia reticulata TaxID=8081 RepID=UPI0004A4B8DE|nr:PREDICTED: tudor domain-containing protein 5 isoform X4 [Poecilia reticulata]
MNPSRLKADNMSQEEVLAKLKKDVRSLLTSTKLGLDPDQLRRDYVAMLGHPMPLKVLGFRNVMDMVQEMPEVVSVNFREDGSLYLKAVSDENTQNIQELVAKQRISKSEKIKKFSSPRYCPRPPFSPLPRRGRPPPALPANLRAQLRILLSQGPLRLSELEARFLRCYGFPLRIHNYGFYSTREMLEAARDLIGIQQGRLGSVLCLKTEAEKYERSQNVMRPLMIPRQPMKPFSTPVRTGPIKPPSVSSHRPICNNSDINVPTTTNSPVLVNQSPLTPPATTLEPDHDMSPGSHSPELPENNPDSEQAPCEDGALFHQNVLKLEDELQHQLLENSVAGTVSQELKDKLRKVVGESSAGISVHDLPAEYKRLFGEELPYLQWGFLSVTELVGALSDIFHLRSAEDNNGNSWIVVDLRDRDNMEPGSEEIDGSIDVNIPGKSYYFTLEESLWENRSENVASDDENNELEFCSQSNIQEMTPEIYPAMQLHSRSPLPLDAMQNERLNPPTRHRARELVEVLVEQVESPGSFYIRFSETEEARALESLMFDMRRCYTCPEVSERYQLLEPFVRQGQVCCVSPNAIWFYRVVIHKVLNSTHVEVFYVDFGDVTLVPIASLKFLKSSFSVLPAQAVPSILAGIQPASDTWTAEATASFRRLCSDQTLVGALDCYTGAVLQLFLCDTHTDQDIYIHTALINQGHGITCDPATAAALCPKVTPVSLYMGEGMVELSEIGEELILSLKSGDSSGQSKESKVDDIVDDDDDEMPPLELIEESEFIPHIQVTELNPCSGLLMDQTPPSSDQGAAFTDESTLQTSAPLAPPDLIQTRNTTAVALCQTETNEVAITSPPTTPSSDSSSSSAQEELNQPAKVLTSSFTEPSSILKRLNQGCTIGSQMSPLLVRNSGIPFPVFGAR